MGDLGILNSRSDIRLFRELRNGLNSIGGLTAFGIKLEKRWDMEEWEKAEHQEQTQICHVRRKNLCIVRERRKIER